MAVLSPVAGRTAQTHGDHAAEGDRRQAKRALLALNFWSADQTGIGPFFSVYLIQHGWKTGLIGTVMMVGGLTGLVLGAPAGWLVDHTRRKRMLVVLSCAFTVLSALVLLASQSFAAVAASQFAGAVAGSVIGPAMFAITLGVVCQAGFLKQNGLNLAFNHAGNLFGAAVSGFIGWRFGLQAVFGIGVVLGSLSIVSVLLIPERAIDHREARGQSAKGDHQISGFLALVRSPVLLAIAVAGGIFALGNACMLSLYGLEVVQAHKGDPAGFTALTVVVAQATMMLVSLAGIRVVRRFQPYWVVLTTFFMLPLRAVLAATLVTAWGVFPVQILDGLSSGLGAIAGAALTARILDGTGRMNLAGGAMGTVSGVFAVLSAPAGGWLAQWLGYGPMFMIMGSMAFVSSAIWLAAGRRIREAYAHGLTGAGEANARAAR